MSAMTAVLLLVAWWSLQADQRALSDALHSRARAAMATPAQLAAISAVEFSGEVRRRQRLSDSIDVQDVTLFFTLPDGFLRRWRPRAPLVGQTERMGALTFGFSGGRYIARVEPPTGGLQFRTLSDAEERDQVGRWRLFATAWLVGLLLTDRTPVPVAYVAVGVAESSDGTADVLEARCETGVTLRVFLDRRTYRIVSMTTPVCIATPRTGEPGEERWYFSDYCRLGGLTVPTLVVIEEAGRTVQEWQFHSVRVNPPLPGDLKTGLSLRQVVSGAQPWDLCAVRGGRCGRLFAWA